jgi:hypothetical protein
MKKNIILIFLFIISITLIISGIILINNLAKETEKKETVLRDSKKEDVYGDQAITGEKLNQNHKYKDLVIKNISFQKRGELYIFEMTIENKGKERFYEQETNLVFYTNTEEKLGSERIYLPVIEPKHSEYVMIQIKNKDFFNACDFKLSEIKSIKYTNEEKKITQVKPAKTE